MRRITSLLVLVVLSAALAACHGRRVTGPCDPAPRPCDQPTIPPCYEAPGSSSPTCLSWPDYRPTLNAFSGRFYLDQTIANAEARVAGDSRWQGVIDAATECRNNTGHHTHLQSTATCQKLWHRAKAAYEKSNAGDYDACLGELNHPDHAN